jgi:ERCC4-type nuclease
MDDNMTIYTSNLPNDIDMNRALGSMALPLPIATGDACFSGVGADDKPLLICVERKHSGDLASCILNGRYQHQLQIAKDNGADVFCLILEAPPLRSNPEDGILEQLNWGINSKTLHRCQMWETVKPAITYSRFDQYLTEIQYLAGVIFKRTSDVKETAAVIKSLWINFQTPPDEHNSLHTVFHSPRQGVLLIKLSLARRVASELPSIGWQWSGVVAGKFPTVQAMVSATVEDWADLESVDDKGKKRKLGMKIAEKVVLAIHEGRK